MLAMLTQGQAKQSHGLEVTSTKCKRTLVRRLGARLSRASSHPVTHLQEPDVLKLGEESTTMLWTTTKPPSNECCSKQKRPTCNKYVQH